MDRAPGRIRLMRDPVEAVKAADVINVDVWASMGQEEEQQRRALHFRDYQVNAALMSQRVVVPFSGEVRQGGIKY